MANISGVGATASIEGLSAVVGDLALEHLEAYDFAAEAVDDQVQIIELVRAPGWVAR